MNNLIQRLVELPPAPFGIDPSQVSSVTALAQQFSFTPLQKGESDNTRPAGAGHGDEEETAHKKGSSTARKGPPHYSHPNIYALRELGDNMILATIDGEISKAEDIKRQLPKWMSLDTTMGTIRLVTVEQAEAGSCAAAIRLTLTDEEQNEVIVAVLVTITDTAQ